MGADMTDLPPVPPGALPGGAPPAAYPSGPPLAPPLPPVPPGAVRPGSPWSTTPPPPPPSPGGRRALVVVAAILVVAALVAATFAAFAGGDDDGDAVAADRDPRDRDETATTAPPSTADTAPPTTASPEDFDAVIAEIQSFVEQERGLPFLEQVQVELADDVEFLDRLLADFEEDVPDIELQGRVLEAVGLLEPDTDIVDAFRTLLDAGVVGFYDPTTNELVVRGTSTTPYVRTVIAHELTHALDDQHFELDRPDIEHVDELGFGFTSLVEGDSRRIEDAYRATFTPAEEREAAAEELTVGAGVDLFDVPPILFDLLLAPYVLGPELVDAVLADGGQARLDAAFDAPPTTSEHLLDPDTFLAGEQALEVPAPAPDDGAAPIDGGVLGAFGLAEVLGANPALLPGLPLDPAVEGWGGDRYVAWPDTDGSGTCLRAVITGDTPDDTAEIASALRDWADSAPFGVTATVDDADGGAGPVTLTSCSA